MPKIGFRKPSISKRIGARTSIKRAVRHRAGLKAPRGAGWITNPRRAAYNRVYNRTTRGCGICGMVFVFGIFVTVAIVAWIV